MSKWPKIIKFVLITTLILPLVYTQWTIYPSHFGKTVFFQMIMAALSVAAYYYLFLRRREVIKPRLLDWLLLAFVGSSLLSSVFGVEWNRSFWGDQSRVQGVFTLIHFTVFYFLLRQFIVSRQDWQRLLSALMVVSAASSLIAWIGVNTPILKSYVPTGRLQGLIGNPIFFANYLLLAVFLSFFCFFYFQKSPSPFKGEGRACPALDAGVRVRRWLWLAIGLLNAATLIGSQTRGPFVGFAIGALTVAVLYVALLSSKRTKAVGASLTAIAIAILALGYIKPAVQGVFPPRLRFIFSINSADATAQTRLMAWKIAVQGWREHPILGAGPESYQDTFDRHYNPRFLHFSFAETVWDQPHNYALEILASRGAVGFVIYLGIIIAALIALWQVIQRSEQWPRRLAAIVLIGAVIGYPTALLFSFETSNSWQLWFVLLALIAWLRFGDGGVRQIRPRSFLIKAVFVVLIFLSVFSLYYNYLMLKSSYYTSYARDAALIQSTYLWQQYAEEAIQVVVPFQWEQAFFLTKDIAILDGYEKLDKEAVAALGPKIEQVFLKYLAKKPDTYLYKFWLGQLYAFMGEFVDRDYYAKAEKTLEETWAINKNRQTVPLLLSKTYYIEGKVDESINILRDLVREDPILEQPHWFLGLNLVRAGNIKEGITELEAGKNFGLGYKNNITYLIDVYAQVKQYEKIPSLYQRLIAEEPENYSYYASLAATYAALGEKERALQNIKKAVELNPALTAEAEQFIKDKGLRKKPVPSGARDKKE